MTTPKNGTPAPQWLLEAIRAAWDKERNKDQAAGRPDDLGSLLGHLCDITGLSYDFNRPLMSVAEMLDYCEAVEGVSESDILLTLVEVSRAAGIGEGKRMGP